MGYDCRIPYRYATFGYQCHHQYGKDVMTGSFWENTTWFWQTNWLIFEIWLLVFLIVLMFIVSCFTPKPTAKQIEAITFTTELQKTSERVGTNGMSLLHWELLFFAHCSMLISGDML